jgi:cAMP-dependent protein kinase regulator
VKPIDTRKLKAEAAEAQSRGAYRKALTLYETLCECDPQDPLGPHRAGELHRRLGKPAEAIRRLCEAAQLYARQGFLIKAIAVSKIILQVDPGHRETQAELSALYSKSREQEAQRVVAAPDPPRAPVPAPRGGGVEAIPVSTSSVSSYAPADEIALELPGADELAALGVKPSAPPPPSVTAPPSGAPQARAKRSASEIRGGIPRVPRPPPSELPLAAVSLAGRLAEAHPLEGPEAEALTGALEIAIEAGEPEELVEEILVLDEVEKPVPRRPLPRTPLFSALDEDALRELIERLDCVTYLPGDTIARQGEVGDSLFVIVSGEVGIVHEGPPRRELRRLSEGTFFGEIAVVSDFPRTATVVATRETEVLRISRAVVWQLVERYPETLSVLLRFLRDRLLETLQSTSPLFLALPPPERQALAAKFKFLEVEADRALIKQGERSEALYFLMAGRLEVASEQGGVRHALGEIGPGAIVGELSLLTRNPAGATVRTVTRCWLMSMGRHAFSEVLMTYPTVLEYVHGLAEKKIEALERLELV